MEVWWTSLPPVPINEKFKLLILLTIRGKIKLKIIDLCHVLCHNFMAVNYSCNFEYFETLARMSLSSQDFLYSFSKRKKVGKYAFP